MSQTRQVNALANPIDMHTIDALANPIDRHTIDALANKFTLAHLKRYNMEGSVPIAPESRKMDWTPYGDQYSNFNAGKILLLLEGTDELQYWAVFDP